MTAISKDIIITVESVEESTKPECPICYEDLNSKNTTKLNPCAHLLCKTCKNSLKNSSNILRCPLCRTLIDEPDEPNEPRKTSLCEWIESIVLVFYVLGIICVCIYGIVLGGIPRILGAAILICILCTLFEA